VNYKKRMMGILIGGLTFAVLPPAAHAAYRDEVLTTAEEVWKAAKTVLTPKGIEREDWNKKTIQSKWIEDYVTKQKEILPSRLGIRKTIPKTVRRRYQWTIQLTETSTGTEVAIAGNFQERPFSGVPSRMHWEKINPASEDYDLERVMFFKILAELEHRRISSKN